jgi:hypothetical protein
VRTGQSTRSQARIRSRTCANSTSLLFVLEAADSFRCNAARTDAFLCHGCYARSFKRDDCPACARPVLGIKGDPYISANGRDYHERCFRCIRASSLVRLAVSHEDTLSGAPDPFLPSCRLPEGCAAHQYRPAAVMQCLLRRLASLHGPRGPCRRRPAVGRARRPPEAQCDRTTRPPVPASRAQRQWTRRSRRLLQRRWTERERAAREVCIRQP